MESNLCDHGGKYAAGSQKSIADFVLASYISNLLMNPDNAISSVAKAALNETPKFKSYIETISKELPNITTLSPAKKNPSSSSRDMSKIESSKCSNITKEYNDLM